MRSLALMTLIAGLSLSVGCTQTEAPVADATPVNTLCPIMGHEIAETGGSTVWNGQTIGFCCKACLPKWNDLSDDEKAAKLASPNETDHSHSEHES